MGAESIRTYVVFMTNEDSPNKSIVCQLCSLVMHVSMLACCVWHELVFCAFRL